MRIVYAHVSRTSGKAYVGFTPRTINKRHIVRTDEERTLLANELLQRRWQQHVNAAKKGSQYAFHAAIRKYTPDDFDHRVLEVCDSLTEVCEREMYWIRALQSGNHENGYNMTLGGDCVMLTPEHRERQRQATKDAMWRPDVRARHLVAQSHPTTKALHSKASKSLWKNPEHRANHRAGWEASTKVKRHAVEQRDVLSGELLAVFRSVSDAARTTNVHKSSLLNHLRGNQKHAGGFVWCYVERDKMKE